MAGSSRSQWLLRLTLSTRVKIVFFFLEIDGSFIFLEFSDPSKYTVVKNYCSIHSIMTRLIRLKTSSNMCVGEIQTRGTCTKMSRNNYLINKTIQKYIHSYQRHRTWIPVWNIQDVKTKVGSYVRRESDVAFDWFQLMSRPNSRRTHPVSCTKRKSISFLSQRRYVVLFSLLLCFFHFISFNGFVVIYDVMMFSFSFDGD